MNGFKATGLIGAVVYLTLAGAPELAKGAAIYDEVNLASDIPGLAPNTDANLRNPWGMSFGPATPFWLSDQGANVATLYNGTGQPQSLVVSMPPGIGPTGQVFNGTTGFQLTPGNPARFIFGTLSGVVAGWNPTVSATAALPAFTALDRASYTGLASGSVGSNNFLYAADFANGKIDVLNSSFQLTHLAGTFTDPNLPADYVPYNIQNVEGNLYVEYALPDAVTHRASTTPGVGAVDEFDPNGNLIRRIATNGPLDSPWGVTLATANFGAFSNDLLIGNFGSGTIDAFDPATNAFLGAISGPSGSPLVLPGLWALNFRAAGSGFPTNSLFFSAGINNEADGLFGLIQPVPEPGTYLLLGLGLLLLAFQRIRQRAS